MKKHITAADLPKIKKLALQNSWWDSVDALTDSFRASTPVDAKVKEIMLIWSKDENFWIRRMSITSQILAKNSTDQDVLSEVIENNFGTDEFFINKAIGWALRDYSKTDPDWVRDFIVGHEDVLNPLSRREAIKYL